MVQHLVEISEGDCSIDDKAILAEENQLYQEVMTGILCLHEELEMHKAERQSADDDLRRLNESLEAKVAQRTEELSTHLELLKATRSQLVHTGKLAGLGELVAGIAHELNTPLLVAKGYNEQIKKTLERKGQVTSSDIGAMIDAVDRGTERMKKIVGHLKDFARPSGPNRKPVDFHSAISDACLLVEPELRTKDIIVATELCAGDPQVWGDSMQLEQVFVNLLTNARDAIMEHGARGGHITIRTRQSGGRVFTEVRDDGPGVPEEFQNKLFEAFFTTKAVGKGTGLGLSISSSIIGDHGGSIAVSSAPGEGCVFRVELPLLALTNES